MFLKKLVILLLFVYLLFFRQSPVERAKAFLISRQNTDGSWQDFFVDSHILGTAGWGRQFVTCYVADVLLFFNDTKQNVDRALSFILSTQKPDGGWSWNENLSSDIDSSAYCSLFLFDYLTKYKEKESEINNALHRAIYFILKHQNPDGGFPAYPSARQEWSQSHPDVSASVFVLLSRMHMVNQELNNYLMSKRLKNGLWPAYWWNDSLYTTHLICKTINCSVNISIQTDKNNPYYTALALQIQKNQSALNYLILKQLSDGSWPSGAVLIYPTKKSNESTTDTNRIWTTTTILETLIKYQNET